MSIWNVILANGPGGEELFYVVAVLILAGLGAIADKLKPKGKEGESPAKPSARPQGRGSVPVRGPRREERPARPARPVSRPVERPVSRPASPPVFQRERPAIPVVPPRPQPPQSDRARRAAAEMAEAARVRQAQLAALQARQAPVADTESRFAEMKKKTKAARARKRSSAGRRGATLLGRLSRQDLRRAIVLNEILQPPLALREK